MSRSRMKAPARLAVIAAATLWAPGIAPVHAGPVTAFESHSEGCAGGGTTCGTFPLIRTGDAEYDHSASTDGTMDVRAEVDGGVPTPDCTRSPCPPNLGRYHAAAAALVWVDVDVPAGSRTVHASAIYRLDALDAAATPALGRASAELAGALTVAEADGTAAVSCSDGSVVTGRITEVIESTSSLGERTVSTTVGCAGPEGSLSAARWRVALRVRVSATADGGAAEASALLALSSVTVEAF